jgi:hypothetical protein
MAFTVNEKGNIYGDSWTQVAWMLTEVAAERVADRKQKEADAAWDARHTTT